MNIAWQISGDGNVVAMGSPKGGSKEEGLATAFVGPEWGQYGPSVAGNKNSEVAGFSVALNYDGSFMAVGSTKASVSNQMRNSGKAAVYTINKDGTKWDMIYEIYGEEKNSLDGSSVALSNDGSVLVIGGKSFNANSKQSAGQCRIFQLKENQYELIHTMLGQTKMEELGYSAAVSEDGNRVVCGGITGRWSSIASVSGVSRMWNRMSGREKTIWPDGDSGDAVNAASFGSAVAIASQGGFVAVGASTHRGTGVVHMFGT